MVSRMEPAFASEIFQRKALWAYDFTTLFYFRYAVLIPQTGKRL